MRKKIELDSESANTEVLCTFSTLFNINNEISIAEVHLNYQKFQILGGMLMLE